VEGILRRRRQQGGVFTKMAELKFAPRSFFPNPRPVTSFASPFFAGNSRSARRRPSPIRTLMMTFSIEPLKCEGGKEHLGFD